MSAVCGVLSQGGRLTAAVGGSGDALVMCPAEGDSSGATKCLSAGPVSLPASIKTGDILLIMASDSRLTFIGSFEGKVSLSAEGVCSTGSTKREKTERGGILF